MYFGTVWTVWAPKKVLVTLFPYIFHVKPKWNIVYEYLKTKIFSRDSNILAQMHWTWNILNLSYNYWGGFRVSLNYPILNFKKTVCPKNVCLWHWSEGIWGCFLKQTESEFFFASQKYLICFRLKIFADIFGIIR